MTTNATNAGVAIGTYTTGCPRFATLEEWLRTDEWERVCSDLGITLDEDLDPVTTPEQGWAGVRRSPEGGYSWASGFVARESDVQVWDDVILEDLDAAKERAREWTRGGDYGDFTGRVEVDIMDLATMEVHEAIRVRVGVSEVA